MCRYGFYNYKLTYGCFNCQVGFKRPLLGDVMKNSEKLQKELAENPETFGEKEFHCPNCRTVMSNLGRDLRLPSKTKNEEWKAIKYLVDHKYNIYSCGCQGIGFVPHTVEEAIDLVKESKELHKKYAYDQDQKNKKLATEKQRKKNADLLRTKLLLREVKKERKAGN
jgi:predicted RNase H-like HicB family nuclease